MDLAFDSDETLREGGIWAESGAGNPRKPDKSGPPVRANLLSPGKRSPLMAIAESSATGESRIAID